MKNEEFTLEYYLERDSNRKKSASERSKEYYHKNKDKIRAKTFIKSEAYESLKKDQDGFCPICGRKPDHLVVDYDPETSRVRGLLCKSCSSGLTLLGNNIVFIKSALQYLKK